MKDFELSLRLRNNRLVTLQRESGLTVGAFCDAVGISIHVWYDLASMKTRPLRHNGKWYPSAQKLAKYSGLSCEELWPPQVLAVQKSKAVMQIDAADVHAILSSAQESAALPADVLYEQKEQKERLESLIHERCTPREEMILRMLYGLDGDEPMTMGEVADSYEVSAGRVQQLANRAKRKLLWSMDRGRAREEWAPP